MNKSYKLKISNREEIYKEIAEEVKEWEKGFSIFNYNNKKQEELKRS